MVAGILVIVLNLLFRIGTSQRAEQSLQSASPTLHADITGLVETWGAAWGARRNVVQRAAIAALEAAEAVAAQGRQLTGMRGSFDEFNLDLEMLHTGAPLALSSARPRRRPPRCWMVTTAPSTRRWPMSRASCCAIWRTV